jgi:alcohol dehydrogenase class IV
MIDQPTRGRVFETYRFDTDVVLGKGIVAAEVADFLRANSRPACVIVGDGRADWVEDQLGPQLHGLSYRTTEIPRTNCYAELSEWAAATSDASCLVVIGGATILDLGKLLTVRRPTGQLLATAGSREEFEAAVARPHLRTPTLAAPTVVGSGAETSSLSDVLLDAHQARSPIISRSLIPDRVVIDAAILANGPSGPQGAAIFDCLMHIIDPWVNSIGAPVMQERTSTALLSEVLRHARQSAARDLTTQEQLDLARLSHLCLRPGLARIGAHASSIHRIEHALPPGFAASHGEGLAWVAARFFEWLERHRSGAAQTISGPLTRAWGERKLPSRLIVETGALLGLRISQKLPPDEVGPVVSRCMSSFAIAGALPGTLEIGEQDVSEILAIEPSVPQSSRTFLSRFPANEKRVLGRTITEPQMTIVVTPIRAVYEALTGLADGSLTAAWLPCAPVRAGGGRSLCLLSPVGASATVDALDLATSTSITPPLIVFAGLAARLDETLTLGEAYVATDVLDASGGVISLSPATECHLRVGSARSLSEESHDLLAYLRFHHVSALDLESAAFAEWCEARSQPGRLVIGISDDLSGTQVRPIWEQQRDAGIERVAQCTDAIVARTTQLLATGDG